MAYVSISNLDSDLLFWDKGLDFYKDELVVFEKRLEEVCQRNNSQDARSGVEHFQNQFLIQRKNIQDIKHHVKQYKSHIGSDVIDHVGRINEDLVEEGQGIKDQYQGLERIMSGLRHDFNQFLGKWM
ncbi:MAG: hypothetical protein RJA57_1988 [Bacteroidota bacterium]|jgi:hypothetical protein